MPYDIIKPYWVHESINMQTKHAGTKMLPNCCRVHWGLILPTLFCCNLTSIEISFHYNPFPGYNITSNFLYVAWHLKYKHSTLLLCVLITWSTFTSSKPSANQDTHIWQEMTGTWPSVKVLTLPRQQSFRWFPRCHELMCLWEMSCNSQHEFVLSGIYFFEA